MNTWSRAVTPSQNSRSGPTPTASLFASDSGRETFHRVQIQDNSDVGTKIGISPNATTKLINPVLQTLQQAKELQKTTDAPDANEVSLDMAAASEMGKDLTRKRKSDTKNNANSAKHKKSVSASVIKRLSKERRSQSKTQLGKGRK